MPTILILALSLVACGDKDDTGGAYADILALDGDTAAGEATFETRCAVCHGADGSGGTGPDLNAEVPGKSDSDLLGIMLEGSGDMAPVGLTDQEAADVLAYITLNFG